MTDVRNHAILGGILAKLLRSVPAQLEDDAGYVLRVQGAVALTPSEVEALSPFLTEDLNV